MAESTVGWFGVREKYYLLADKTWLISQIRPSEQAIYSSFAKSAIINVAARIQETFETKACRASS